MGEALQIHYIHYLLYMKFGNKATPIEQTEIDFSKSKISLLRSQVLNWIDRQICWTQFIWAYADVLSGRLAFHVSTKIDKINCDRFQKKKKNTQLCILVYGVVEIRTRGVEIWYIHRIEQQNDQRDCHRKMCIWSKLRFPADMLFVPALLRFFHIRIQNTYLMHTINSYQSHVFNSIKLLAFDEQWPQNLY